ncbi:hypothetical protein NUK42_01995 [Aeromonas veronii]|nr:hypothetical protein [Aeromonas veronii]MCR3957521.1 hypothetical protein [Aeromonas veronii]
MTASILSSALAAELAAAIAVNQEPECLGALVAVVGGMLATGEVVVA